MKKAIVTATLLAFCLALTGCATTSGGQMGLSRSEIKKLEKENGYNFIKGISAFSGFVIGGLVGILTAPGNDKIMTMLKGCVIGAGAGLGAGYVITENMKNAEPKPDSSKTDKYFDEYKIMKNREKEKARD